MNLCFNSDGKKKCWPLPILPNGTLKPNNGNMSTKMRRSLQIKSQLNGSYFKKNEPVPVETSAPGATGPPLSYWDTGATIETGATSGATTSYWDTGAT